MTVASPQFQNPLRTSPLGYVADNNEGAELKLFPGKKYRLLCTQACSFPLYISNASSGTTPFGNSAIPPTVANGIQLFTAAGVSTTDYNQICAGGYIDFTPQNSQVDTQFYYQATTALGLGWKITIVGTTTFNANVVLMTMANPQFTNPLRISSGYTINGREGPVLSMSVGQIYRIRIQSTCAHPMYISMDPNGGGVDFMSINVTVPLAPHGIVLKDSFGNPLPSQTTDSYLQMCNGNIIEITPQVADIGQTFYYQCAYHIGMGWQIQIVAQTFCEKYVDALGQYLFMDSVFAAIIANIVADPVLLPFFDAENAALTSPQCCLVNFLNTTSEYLRLKLQLTAFFGAVLGCNDPSFPAYTGPTNMQALHALMPISTTEYLHFNNVVQTTVLGLGVTAADYAPLGAFLVSQKNAICNSGDCRTSICDRYTDALKAVVVNNTGLLTFVVTQTIGRLVAVGAPTKKYFDGTQPTGSTNFTSPSQAATLNSLVMGLVAFFGQKGILSCSDPGFAAYMGPPNLTSLHQPMMIAAADFDFFNQALIGVLAAAGVTAADQSAVLAILETTRAGPTASIVYIPPNNSPQPPPPSGPAIPYDFVVAAKNSSHPNFNKGFSQGFYSLQGPITLNFGQTYMFIYNGTCAHPLYLTTDSVGGGSGEVDGGISAPDYTLVCGSNAAAFTVSINQNFCNNVMGQQVYYNCRVHGSMGGPVTVTGCPASKGTTFCEIYANTLNISQLTLVQAVVNGTLPLLIAVGSPTKKYFDGTQPPGSVNFLAPASAGALSSLLSGLYAFFGAALQCTDPTYPKYTGGTLMSIHQYMGINQMEFDFFNKQILNVMNASGVTAADQAGVLAVLSGTAPSVLGSFCVRYSSALGIPQRALVTFVVNATIVRLVTPGSIDKKYFDGTRPGGSLNFLLPSSAGTLQALNDSLVAFFGTMALGCNDPAFPAYTGTTDLASLHNPMGIGNDEFDFFNQQILGVMQGAGVIAADLTAVQNILETTRPIITATFCQRYAVTLGISQLTLLQVVVNATIGRLVAPGSVNKKYFDGTTPAGSTNFLSPLNAAALTTLFNHLVQFFGQTGVLGCNDPAFPAYQGNTDLGAVHRGMGISNSEFDNFGQQLIGVLNASGVTAADQTAVSAILETTRTLIVVPLPPPPPTTTAATTTTGSTTPPPTTFCAKYATALSLSQADLVAAVVDGTVALLVNPVSPNLKYFNGVQPAGSTNFLAPANAQALINLKNGLVAFFGQAGVLGCNDPNFPVYMGPMNMFTLHQPMMISQGDSDAFNAALLSVLMSAGVTDQNDLNAVSSLLNSVSTSSIVYQGPPPSTTSPTTGTPGTTGTTPTGQTFCSKYATAKNLTQVTLLGAVVDGQIGMLTAPGSVNLKYFNGVKPPGSTNFLTDTVRLATLRAALIAFFGGALGCNDPTFPVYTGPTDLTALHAPMGITSSENDAFTADLISVLQGAGVMDPNDLSAVQSVLKSVAPQIVSGGSSSNQGGSSTGGLQTWQIGVIAAVGFAVVVAIVVVIVCCIKRGKGEGSNYVAF